MPTVLCGSCGRAVLRLDAKSTPSLPQSFLAGKNLVESQARRSSRKSVTEGHQNCALCAIENDNFSRGCVSVPKSNLKLEKEVDIAPKNTARPEDHILLSHKDLKRIQVENGLTQNQILGVVQGIRYACVDV